jgi:hypothetical protein
MPDFDRQRRVWHDHIARWRRGENLDKLWRGTSSRPATMAMSQYSPRERGLYVDGAVRFQISALGVTADNVPDPERDEIEFRGKRYKILMLPQNPMPDGTFIAFEVPAVALANP